MNKNKLSDFPVDLPEHPYGEGVFDPTAETGKFKNVGFLSLEAKSLNDAQRKRLGNLLSELFHYVEHSPNATAADDAANVRISHSGDVVFGHPWMRIIP